MVGQVPGRTLTLSAIGMTIIAEAPLPPPGPVTISMAEIGMRSALLTFSSEVIATITFDVPLDLREFAALVDYPERSSATAASRSNR